MKRIISGFIFAVLCLLIGSCGESVDEKPQGDSGKNQVSDKNSVMENTGKVKGLADNTAGAFIYTRRFRQNVDGECNNPPGGAIDKVFVRANTAPFWTYIGNVDEELVSFTPGDPAEVSGNPIDTNREDVFKGLKTADDFQPVVSGNDGDMNYDTGTSGTITVRPGGDQVIRADGRPATGYMSTASMDPRVALDGCEIFIFEDAELSGYTLELAGPNQKIKVVIDDYQNDIKEGDYGDDTMLAIDLDTLEGWTDPYIETITITDDGISRNALGRCAQDAIDTSVELDAVAVRKDVLSPR